MLGCILLESVNAMEVALHKLSGEDSFYNPAHQRVFSVLKRMTNERPTASVDLVTLSDALAKDGALEDVGGPAFLAQLMNSVPSAANVEHYVDIVHEAAVLRRLIRTGAGIVERCYDPQERVDELLDQIEEQILSVKGQTGGSTIENLRDLVLPAINHLDSLHSKDPKIMGVQTGYGDFDRIIGGLRDGEMTVLAARPSIGKTALALNLIANVALRANPTPVGIFSLEMNSDLLVLRMICSEARVGMSDIRDGALSTARWHDIMAAGTRLREAPVLIDDTGSLDIVELRARARRMKRDADIGLLVIDYLQLLRVNVGRNATRENEVSRMSGGIKALAKELKIPIIVLAQLNRQAEQPGQRPRLGHLRESGAIEQDADIVALLHRERGIENEGGQPDEGMESELIIAKHRNGPTGIVPLTFIPAYTRFEPRSRIADEDVPGL